MSDALTHGNPPRRPRYLLFATLALWVVGAYEADEAFGMLRVIWDPITGEIPDAALANALLDAVRNNYRSLLPPYAAQLVINVAMFAMAARLLFTGRANIPLLLQIMGVNAAVLTYTYLSSHPLYTARIQAILQDAQFRQMAIDAGEDPASLADKWWWLLRGLAVTEVLALGACAIAITRPKSRRFIAWCFRQKQEEEE